MTPDLRQEFQSLSARAQHLLKDVAVSRGFREIYSLWTKPSFTPSSRCTICAPTRLDEGKSPFAEYSIWRSDLDLEKFVTPVERLRHPRDLAPTIENDVLRLSH